ncbi:MAG: signal peptidase II [Thermodesulfobacteriota bacterium]
MTSVRGPAAHWPAALLAAGVVGLDQLTKIMVLAGLPVGGRRPIIPGFFDLVHARNTGAAFSLLAGEASPWRQAFFVAVALVALVVLGIWYRQLAAGERLTRLAIALVAGGAVGNLIDRLRLGQVVDFLDVFLGQAHWPAFNIADSAITVGVGLLFLAQFAGRRG